MIFIPVGFCFYITEAEILKKKKKKTWKKVLLQKRSFVKEIMT